MCGGRGHRRVARQGGHPRPLHRLAVIAQYVKCRLTQPKLPRVSKTTNKNVACLHSCTSVIPKFKLLSGHKILNAAWDPESKSRIPAQRQPPIRLFLPLLGTICMISEGLSTFLSAISHLPVAVFQEPLLTLNQVHLTGEGRRGAGLLCAYGTYGFSRTFCWAIETGYLCRSGRNTRQRTCLLGWLLGFVVQLDPLGGSFLSISWPHPSWPYNEPGIAVEHFSLLRALLGMAVSAPTSKFPAKNSGLTWHNLAFIYCRYRHPYTRKPRWISHDFFNSSIRRPEITCIGSY